MLTLDTVYLLFVAAGKTRPWSGLGFLFTVLNNISVVEIKFNWNDFALTLCDCGKGECLQFCEISHTRVVQCRPCRKKVAYRTCFVTLFASWGAFFFGLNCTGSAVSLSAASICEGSHQKTMVKLIFRHSLTARSVRWVHLSRDKSRWNSCSAAPLAVWKDNIQAAASWLEFPQGCFNGGPFTYSRRHNEVKSGGP